MCVCVCACVVCVCAHDSVVWVGGVCMSRVWMCNVEERIAGLVKEGGKKITKPGFFFSLLWE